MLLPQFHKLKVVDKIWGQEHWVENNKEDNYCGKLLYFKPGFGFSNHAHYSKVESWLIFSSIFKLEYFDLEKAVRLTKTLYKGDCIFIQKGVFHKLTNTGDEEGLIFEVSTFHRDEDSYRIEKGEIPEVEI